MKILRLLPVLLLFCACLPAQFETAVVLGTVRDASQSAVPGAKVTLLNIGTGIQASTTTDDNGNYLFNNVKIGRYKVTVEKSGFTTAIASDFQVDVNARQRVDLALAVGQVSECLVRGDDCVALALAESGRVLVTYPLDLRPEGGGVARDLRPASRCRAHQREGN